MLQLKAMYPAITSRYIWREIIPKLDHHSDGLVYTPVNKPYESGTCDYLLKWKPYDLNSVDFELRVEYFNNKPFFELHTSDNGVLEFFDWISFDKPDEYTRKAGQIVECVFDPVLYL